MTVAGVGPGGAPDYVGFGRYLRQQRELRGVSLEAIARSSKIPPTLIDALEEGQAERFPEHVFLLNYIRSYASAVGLSPDEAVNRYQQIPEAPKPAEFDPAALEVVRQERALTTLWALVAALTAATFAFAGNAMYELALRFASR